MTPVNKEDKKRRRRIRKLLVDRDQTVAGLAREIGKSRQWTSRVLYGHIESDHTLIAIAEALDVPVEFLMPNGKRAA